ncbi:flagellar hook-length control protein FliK [Planococcus versutus]|uniref:Flagellar hook-length control protein-like C-terminal domain-containing protein n=1 Tax=Planococcus versutus TaxID=1302659 RepID=A0A1B1S0K0_9BACL|nr:flagellar hook-length control protein FliK [Planococcus versutus]ANU26720.1 hypothetical protein I858_006730 [Planococcus versutus]
MEALKPMFQQTISPITKTTSKPVLNQAEFASLLESLAPPHVSEQPAPAESIVEILESVLVSLQELLIEEPTTEHQEIQYAILQLQELQTESKQAHLTMVDQNAPDSNSKLVVLLEKIGEQLQVLSDKSTRGSEKTSIFNEPEEEKKRLGFNGLAQISKKLSELIDMLEKQQQVIKLDTQLKTVEREVPLLSTVNESHSVKNISKLVSEILKPLNVTAKLSVETQVTPKELELVDVTPLQKSQSKEEIQSLKVPVEVETVQPLPIAIDGGKSSSFLMKAEASQQPSPLIRLPNLLEDLSGMLKNSMRLAESQEGMKMRVNIFPEHLGHLEILLTSTNGKLAAQIMASTPMAKEAIELQLNQLRTSLIQQGVEVEKIEVLEQSSQRSFSQQQPHAEQRFTQQQQNKALRNGNRYFQSEDELVKEIRKPLSEGLMKIDYTV